MTLLREELHGVQNNIPRYIGQKPVRENFNMKGGLLL